MLDEYKAAGIVGACAGLLLLLLMCATCDDGRDLIDPPVVTPVTAGSGCSPPPDAGPDCTCPDGGGIVVIPGCGVVCGLE